MNNWNHFSKPHFGLTNQISAFIEKLEKNNSITLPNLRHSKDIFIFSDYGGEHKESLFNTYSFLFTNIENVTLFRDEYIIFNKKFNVKDRVIEYKKLNDRIRFENLIPFLEFSNNLNGLLFSISIEKNIRSLFYQSEDIPIEYKIWKTKVFEKLLRICHLISVFISCLTKDSQNLVWISDEDSIVANDNQLTVLTQLLGNVSSHYLNHDLGHLRCGRSNIEVNNLFEYLCAIPDLASGGLNEILMSFSNENKLPNSEIIVPTPKNTKEKAKTIGGWFIKTPNSELSKLALSINLTDKNEFNIKHIKFHNINIL